MKNYYLKSIALSFFVNLLVLTANANNLQITGVTQLVGNRVQFTLSWDNSWNNGTQHDAVWVFIKYRKPADPACIPSTFVPYTHTQLTPAQPGIPGTVLTYHVDANPDNTGIMLWSSIVHYGTINTNCIVQLTTVLPANAEINVFGIEMTYINPGAFSLGDGYSDNHFYENGNPNTSYQVLNNNLISVGSGAGQLWATGNVPAGNIPALYPKGYAAFYCMKTEITQQQYVDFLNTLSFDQATNRYEPGPDGTYSLGGSWPNFNTGGIPDEACSDLSFNDIAAYFDWAALRPMTELEFEKVCRGPVAPVAGEYAWGNTTLVQVGTRQNSFLTNETVSNIGVPDVANYVPGTSYGTLRVGFLGSATSTRLTNSAGYYGNTELSGNVWEQIVNVSAGGLSYNGQWGDGYLSADGYANVPNWVGSFLVPLGTSGTGFMGGAWYGGDVYLQVSERNLDYFYYPDTRFSNVGGRGCR